MVTTRRRPIRSDSVPEISWSSANGTRYAGTASAISVVVASNASRSSGISTASTAPPNGPRNPPTYSGSVRERCGGVGSGTGAGLGGDRAGAEVELFGELVRRLQMPPQGRDGVIDRLPLADPRSVDQVMAVGDRLLD